MEGIIYGVRGTKVFVSPGTQMPWMDGTGISLIEVPESHKVVHIIKGGKVFRHWTEKFPNREIPKFRYCGEIKRGIVAPDDKFFGEDHYSYDYKCIVVRQDTPVTTLAELFTWK